MPSNVSLRLAIAFLIFAFFCFSDTAFAAYVRFFTATPPQDKYHVTWYDAIIDGEITQQDVNEFSWGISRHTWTNFDQPPRERVMALHLNSLGGDAYAAMAIGRIVRKQHLVVDVNPDMRCYSSCALIYIAGVDRNNLGTIGLHRPYLAGTPLKPTQIEGAMAKMLADVHNYVLEMGIADDFVNMMMNTDPSDVKTYTADEINALVPGVDPTMGEISVAYTARKMGITTEEYRRRKNYADNKCRNIHVDETSPETLHNSIYAHSFCDQAASWGLSVPIFQARSAEADKKCFANDAQRSIYYSRGIYDPPAPQYENCIRRVMLNQ